MPDGISCAVIGAGAAVVGLGLLAIALTAAKLCPVCDHLLTQGVQKCPYCLNQFEV